MIRPIDESEIRPQRHSQAVETRVLTEAEVLKYIHPIYQERGQPLPNPAVSTFIGVVRAGKVVAFLGIEAKLHAEPLWIEDGEASHLIPLVHKAEEFILSRCGPQWVYVFAPPGKVARIAEHMGMTLEPWCVYTKLVAPPIPPKPLVTLEGAEQEPITIDIDGIVQ